MRPTLLIVAVFAALLNGLAATTHTRLGISLDMEPLGNNHYSIFPSTFVHWTSVEFAGNGNTTAAEQVLEPKPTTKSFPFSSVLSTTFEYALSEDDVAEDVMSTLGAMQSRGKMSTDEARVALALYLAYVTEEGDKASSGNVRHVSFVAKDSSPLLRDAMALVNRRRHRKGDRLLQYSTTSPEKAALLDMIATRGGGAASNTLFVHFGWSSTTVSLWKRVSVEDAQELSSISFNGGQGAMAAVTEDSRAIGLSSVVDHLFETIVKQQGFHEAKLTPCEKGSIWKAAELVFRKLGAESSSEIEYVIHKDCGTDGSLSSATKQSIGQEQLTLAFRTVFRAINNVLEDVALEAMGGTEGEINLKIIAPFSLRNSVTASLHQDIASRLPSLSSDSFSTIVQKNLAIGASFQPAPTITTNKDSLLLMCESGLSYDNLVSYVTVDGFEEEDLSPTQSAVHRSIAECFERANFSPLNYCKAELHSLPSEPISTEQDAIDTEDTDTVSLHRTTVQTLTVITVLLGAIQLTFQRSMTRMKNEISGAEKNTKSLMESIKQQVDTTVERLGEQCKSMNGELDKKLDARADELKSDVSKLEKNTKSLMESIKQQLDSKIVSLGHQANELKSAVTGSEERTRNLVNETTKQVDTTVERLGEQCKSMNGELDKKLDARADELKSDISKLEKNTKSLMESIKQQLDSKIVSLGHQANELKSAVTGSEERTRNLVNETTKQVDTTVERLGEQCKSMNGELDKKLDARADELKSDVSKLEKNTKSLMESIKQQLDSKIVSLGHQANELKSAVTGSEERTRNLVNETTKQVDTTVERLGEQCKSMNGELDKKLDARADELKSDVSKLEKNTKSLMESIKQQLDSKIISLGERNHNIISNVTKEEGKRKEEITSGMKSTAGKLCDDTDADHERHPVQERKGRDEGTTICKKSEERKGDHSESVMMPSQIRGPKFAPTPDDNSDPLPHSPISEGTGNTGSPATTVVGGPESEPEGKGNSSSKTTRSAISQGQPHTTHTRKGNPKSKTQSKRKG